MNVEIGTEAAQFPEKEYINGISLAVRAICFPSGMRYGSETMPNLIWKSVLVDI